MSERNNDDIANALHGLASGDHVEPEPHEGSGTGQAHHLDGLTHPPAPPPAPPPPAPRPPALRLPPVPQRATPKPMPPSSSASGSAPPAPARPNVPTQRPRAHPQPQPAPGARPAIPAAPRAAQQPGPARPQSPVQPGGVSRNVLPPGARPPSPPASPNLTPPGPSATGGPGAGSFVTDPAYVETTDVQPVDEDDRVIVPAAPLSSLGPRTRHGPVAPHVPLFKTLNFRRTAIPVLLTAGLLLLFVAALKFLVNGDAVLATMPMGMCLGLAGAGILLLCVAALNVTQVRHQLAAEKAAAAAPKR